MEVSVVSVCLVLLNVINYSLGDTPKTSSSSTTTKYSIMINWEKLDVVDYLRSGALVVAFFAVLLSDIRGRRHVRSKARNMWVNAEVISFFVSGLALFFFPGTFLEYISRTSLNSVHKFAVQFTGCCLVHAAVSTARQQKSLESDAVVYSSWILSRLVASGSLFILLLRAHTEMDVFTDQNATFVLLGVLLWFVGCLCQFFISDKLGSAGLLHSLTHGINFYLMIEVVIVMVIALMQLSQGRMLSQMALTVKLDDFNMHLIQVIGMLVASLNIQFFGAFYYSTDDDKRHLLFGRLLLIVMVVPLAALYQWKHALFKRNWMILVAVVTTIRFAACLRGYLMKNKSKTQ